MHIGGFGEILKEEFIYYHLSALVTCAGFATPFLATIQEKMEMCGSLSREKVKPKDNIDLR